MANVVTVSDGFQHNARQRYIDYNSSAKKDRINEQYKRINNNSRSKRDQMRTTSTGQHYGGVEKAKTHSTFKQPFLYETLITMAIRSSPTQALTLAEIHAYIAEIYPYFKAFPGSLKADIIRTLSTSYCFVKLGAPCQHYWTLTRRAKAIHEEKGVELIGNLSKRNYSHAAVSCNNPTPHLQSTAVSSNITSFGKAKTCARTTEDPNGLAKQGDKPSERIGSLSQRTYSQATVSTSPYYSESTTVATPSIAHLQAKISTTPYSQPDIASTSHSQATVFTTPYFSQPATGETPSTAHSQANSRQPDFIHDDLLRRYIHNSPLYPRVPVITPARQSWPEESGIKIGRVFSLNPQSSTAIPTVMQPFLPLKERLRTNIVPYHPCTLWMSQVTPNSPTLSSFVSEDKERYEDA